MRSEKSSSSSSSSRKNKKSNIGSDKPKQPQRGLGVAQLEQIRLRSQITCDLNPPKYFQEDGMKVQEIGPYGFLDHSPSSTYYSSTYGNNTPNYMIPFEDDNLKYQHSEPRLSTSTRWNPNRSVDLLNNSIYRQLEIPCHQHLHNYFEDQRHDGIDSTCPITHQNTQSSDLIDDVDLELRLSII